MMSVEAVPGSFRDPSGRVYRLGDRFVRTVTAHFSEEFDYVQGTGLLEQLVKRGQVLPAERVGSDILGSSGADAIYALEVPPLPFVSFPYEWPFSALKAAALLHLEIHLAALERGVTLSDASAYNIQFQGARPVFIDHLSFRRYRDGEVWAGHRQFCEQFLNPLLLRSLFGNAHNAWYRGTQEGITAEELYRFLGWRHVFRRNVLTHVVLQAFLQRSVQNHDLKVKKEHAVPVLPLKSFRGMLQKLANGIEALEPADTGKTIWADYAKTHSYSSEEATSKRQFVTNFARQTQPRLLWDVGCNTGDYSKAALEGGAKYVVGFDFDQGVLEAGFARSREEGLAFQPLFMDSANPPPNQGWQENERQGLQARASAEGVLALALIHHLAIGRNIPLDRVVDWLVGLAPQGVIEFVPKSDPMVQRLLQLREDIFPYYTEESFMTHLCRRAAVVDQVVVSASKRLLVWYARK